jgi:hypothetical protein
MKFAAKMTFAIAVATAATIGLSACSPKEGSKEWCEVMKKKDKGTWTANEAEVFAKNCIF